MKSTKSAIRYAKALLELSIENSNLDEVSSDMNRIVESSNETNDFKVFLSSPVIKSDKKIKVLKVLFVGFEKLTSSFIDLITKNKREYLLVEIAEAYLYLLKKIKWLKILQTQVGILTVKVYNRKSGTR